MIIIFAIFALVAALALLVISTTDIADTEFDLVNMIGLMGCVVFMSTFIYCIRLDMNQKPLEVKTVTITTSDVSEYFYKDFIQEEDSLYTLEIVRATKWPWWSQFGESDKKIMSVRIKDIKKIKKEEKK